MKSWRSPKAKREPRLGSPGAHTFGPPTSARIDKKSIVDFFDGNNIHNIFYNYAEETS